MDQKNLYITPMFPYPSGSGLHCGHWYNYAIVDSYCRYKRYQGFNVFQPFGYDAFGSEHACMHLIYIRFITMFLYDIGFIDFQRCERTIKRF